MSKKIKARINWSKNSPLKMAGIAHGVASAMKGNATFPSPPVKASENETAATRVELAWANRKNGDLGKDELKNSCTDLDDKLHVTADYVNSVANGFETIIHSAGFESTGSTYARTSNPVAASSVTITSNKGGVIKAKALGAKGARMYTFILVLDAVFNVTLQNGVLQLPPDSANVFIINSTKGSVNFSGLPAKKDVSVAVVLYNSAGDSGLSPIATSTTIA